MDVTAGQGLLGRVGELVRPGHHRVLPLAAVTGVATGAAVAGFEWLTQQQLLDRLVTAPVAVQATAPLIGLALTAVFLARIGRGASPSTSDEYIHDFHDPAPRPRPRVVLARVMGGIATLGSGGALGFEGPSLYIGASLGAAIQTRWPRWFRRDDAKVLMVAGAAAGVAAIFKAPATGAVFALEVPYRDDTAKGMLLPALLASACGYLTFVSILGTAPLFPIAGVPPIDLRELAGAAVLGLLAGLGARGFAWLISRAKRVSRLGHPALRVAAAGSALAIAAVLSQVVYGDTLAIGSGYRVLDWVGDPDHSLALVVGLLVFRVLTTSLTVTGSGVGGLFVPLVVTGALLGDATALAVDDTTGLLPVIGIAAFLGAGYRTPLAGVMFVAETTGRPGFIVPGLIASVAAQLVMGDTSVATYQHAGRTGYLERRLGLPIAAAIDAEVTTVPPEVSLRELYELHLKLKRRTAVPVASGSRFEGIVSLHELASVPAERWDATTVGAVMDRSGPVGRPDWTLGRAVAVMDAADVELLPVCDEAGRFVGVVTTAEITQLGAILDQGERGDTAGTD